MGELMRANLFRLRRDRVFWACLAALLLASAAVMGSGVRQCRALAAEGYVLSLSGVCFRLVLAGELALGVFSGLYLGTDHSEGALRNRLIAGHSRRRVYLTQLWTTMLAALALTLAWLLGGGLPALWSGENWGIGPGRTALLVLVALGSAACLASILTAVGMCTEKKSAAAVAALLLVLGLLALALWLYARLQEPEMNVGIILTAQGMEWGEPTANPNYVSGTLRQVFQLLLEVLPTGQAVLLAGAEAGRPVLELVASLAVSVLAAAVGLCLFEKKDLR